LRLFACACCRLVGDHLEPGLIAEAVEMGERIADGLVPWEAAQPYLTQLYSTVKKWLVGRSVDRMAAWGGAIMSVAADCALLKLADRGEHTNYGRVTAATSARQPALLRDIFGNPFRPVDLNNAWLTQPVAERAYAAYENRILPAGNLDPERLCNL